MKIKFLGTSAGWPLPRLGCSCHVCASTDPRDKRTRTQLLINDILLLDVGIDTYHHLIKPDVNPTKIKFAAITHEHPDHTLGLWDLGHTYLFSRKGKTGLRIDISIIIHPNTFSKLRHLFFRDEYKILKTQSNKTTKINGLEVTLLPVNHTNSSFGILVSEGGKKLFYAPDMKSLPEETFKKINRVDLIAFDGSELKIKSKSHQTILEGTKLGKELKAKQVYFIHIGHRTLPYKELEGFVKDKGGKQFNISYDGLEINL